MNMLVTQKPSQQPNLLSNSSQGQSNAPLSATSLRQVMEGTADSVMKSMLSKLSGAMGMGEAQRAPVDIAKAFGSGTPQPGAQPPVAEAAPVPQPAPAPAEPPPLSPEQQKMAERMDVVAVLQRNEGMFKKAKNGGDIDKMLNDTKNPPSPELKNALETLKKDPELMSELDGAKKGGKTDGKFSAEDIQKIAQSPEMIEYNRQKADTYTNNYIASDVTDQNAEGRPITANDAQRELYKYSDNLPKNVSQKDLQDIVDGTGKEGKRPPQLVAAAKYMVDHPDTWKELTGKEGNKSISRSSLCDNLSKHTKLDASESKALDTVEKNFSDFGGKSFDRKKLDKIIADPNSKPENVEAAKKLKDDPMLFGMLDNAQRGHKGGLWHAADDGKIGKGDISAFRKKMDKAPAEEPAKLSPEAAALKDPTAVNEMKNGQLNQPDTKTEKGGGFKKFVMGLMKVISAIEKIGSAVLGAVAALKIPGISQLAAVGSMATNAIAGGLDVGRTAIAGGDVKAAGIKAAASFGANALSSLTAPGVGNALTKGALANVKSLGGAAGGAAASAAGGAAAKAGSGAVAPAVASAGRNIPMFQGSAVTQSQLTNTMVGAAGKEIGKTAAGEAASQYLKNQQQSA